MTTVINNLFEFNAPSGSKDYYKKNRLIQQKFMKKLSKKNDPSDVKRITKKQKLSYERKDKKYEQANNNQFYNRTSKIKEKMFCPQDEIDLQQDFENELKINQQVLDEIEAEKLHKARLELVETWIQELIKASQKDFRYVTRSESEVLCFMEKHDVDPAQIQYAEKALQGLIADSKRYEWSDEDWHIDGDSDDDDWYTGCWH